MKTWIWAILAISVSIGILIIAGSISYYLLVYIPQKENLDKNITNQILNEPNYYQICDEEANSKAHDLIRSKAEIASETGKNSYKALEEGIKKGLIIRQDYNNYFEQCLNSHGLSKP